jgi:hypothetical protein
MFGKIVAIGNADVIVSRLQVALVRPSHFSFLNLLKRPPDPEVRPPTRFLSRFDKSATNIKESQIFCTIGQVLPPTRYFDNSNLTWFLIIDRFRGRKTTASGTTNTHAFLERHSEPHRSYLNTL